MKATSLKIKGTGRSGVKSYVFHVELEPDENGWRAFYPQSEEIGASTWDRTQEESLKNPQEVLAMILEEFSEEGKAVPDTEYITVAEGAVVSVNVYG